jgi:hypothetical protein
MSCKCQSYQYLWFLILFSFKLWFESKVCAKGIVEVVLIVYVFIALVSDTPLKYLTLYVKIR